MSLSSLMILTMKNLSTFKKIAILTFSITEFSLAHLKKEGFSQEN